MHMLAPSVHLVWSCALAFAPTFPPPGWALVEGVCEKCVESKNAYLKATFSIWGSSAPGLTGSHFEIEYETLNPRAVSNDNRRPKLSPFAVDDRAFFWVRLKGNTVVPVTVVSEDHILRATPSYSYFMRPIRSRYIRRNDDYIVNTSIEYKRDFADPVMKAVSEKNLEKRVALLRMYSESDDEMLKKWAKWVLLKYYSPQFAQSGSTQNP